MVELFKGFVRGKKKRIAKTVEDFADLDGDWVMFSDV